MKHTNTKAQSYWLLEQILKSANSTAEVRQADLQRDGLCVGCAVLVMWLCEVRRVYYKAAVVSSASRSNNINLCVSWNPGAISAAV
jgi:hypothetical protein